MVCPYCGTVMKKGYIASVRPLEVYFSGKWSADFAFSEKTYKNDLLGYKTDCYSCKYCKAAIIPQESERE